MEKISKHHLNWNGHRYDVITKSQKFGQPMIFVVYRVLN